MGSWRDVARSGARRLTALKPQRIRTSHWFIGMAASVALIIGIASAIWWDSIQEALHDPGIPYQTYSPPPAPNYAARDGWVLIPEKPETWTSKAPPADIFFVHPTTYQGRAHWNGPIENPRANRVLDEVMIPNYAGPFSDIGRVFAPRYRQASLYSQITLREDARDARAFAYDDVKAAFDHYLAQYHKGRPLIIVGVEQGGFIAARLAREAVNDPAVAQRLAAVYLIETAVPASGLALPACTKRDQARCTVVWLSEAFNEGGRTAERLRHSSAWNGEAVTRLGGPPVCVNPLLGGASSDLATERSNLGAVNAAGLEWGVRPGFQLYQVGARCVDGVLKISRPKSPSLRQRGGWVERHRVRGFNLFYADIEADAEARLKALFGGGEVGRMAPPLEGEVVIKPSPVHRIN